MDSADEVKPKRKARVRSVTPVAAANVAPAAPDVSAEVSSAAGATPKRAAGGKRSSRSQQELDLIAACKEKSAAALEVMASLMVTGENERTRMTAAQFILERAYGKAVQQVDGDLDVALQISRIERVILKP